MTAAAALGILLGASVTALIVAMGAGTRVRLDWLMGGAILAGVVVAYAVTVVGMAVLGVAP